MLHGLARVLIFVTVGFLPTIALADHYATDGITVGERHMLEADVKGGVQGLLAPGTAVPKIGPNGTEMDYLKWAKNSLDRRQTAEAELSLEWGQVRRRVDEEELALQNNQPPPPYDSLCVRMLCQALKSIGLGRTSEASADIDTAIADLSKRGGK